MTCLSPHLELELLANHLRYEVLLMAHRGKTAHVASALSCLDLILGSFYFLKLSADSLKDPYHHRFILSKGHAISALYAVLAYLNFFPKEWLLTFNKDGSSLPEHPIPNCVPGLEIATGSLGHGFSIGIGEALAAKILKKEMKVITLLGDGECNEGSIWEGALFAPNHHLSNLIVLIDFNKWQATDRSEEVMSITPLKQKWESFGWRALEIDGHNYLEILSGLNSAAQSDKPTAIIAHTIKGKGISFMEDDNNWHYKVPSEEELKRGKEELGLV